MPLMQVKMVQQIGPFFTEHRCICSLPKKIPRISEGDYFCDRHQKQLRKIQLKPIYLALGDLETQSLPGLHSFSGTDIVGTVE